MLEKITQSHRNRSQTKTIFDLRPLYRFHVYILLFTALVIIHFLKDMVQIALVLSIENYIFCCRTIN
jgi:hypothetical protein